MMILSNAVSIRRATDVDANKLVESEDDDDATRLPLSRLFPRKGGGGHGGGHASGEGDAGASAGSAGKGSPAAAHGASTAFTGSRSVAGFHVLGNGKTTATAYADGGGKPFVLGADTPFGGREAGGGDRGSVYGTSRFGSGYPYGGFGSFVGNRPFPFVFFPVPPAHHYYDGDEYLNVNETERPGGNLVSAIVQPSWNTSITYRLLGDNNSVTAVFDALVANCSVVNSSSAINAYAPSLDTWPLPEQVIQYYRASTFALALDGYNNSAALPANAPADNSTAPLPLAQDTPLPAGLNATFLVCVNTTVGASVPLLDVAGPGMSARETAAIVVPLVVGFLVMLWCMHGCTNSEKRERRGYGRSGF